MANDNGGRCSLTAGTLPTVAPSRARRMRACSHLPASLPPRLLSRGQAAEYWGVSASFFDGLVADGIAPQPKVLRSRRAWDLYELDKAISALPSRSGHAEDVWSQVAV